MINWTGLVVLTFQLLVSQCQACKLQAVTRFYRRICRREQGEREIAAVSTPQLHTGTNDTTVGAILDQDTGTETAEGHSSYSIYQDPLQWDYSSDSIPHLPFVGPISRTQSRQSVTVTVLT